MSTEDRVCLGAIIGVHGIKGEVKLKSFSDDPRGIGKYGSLENKTGDQKFDIKITGNSKELLRAKIKGVDDRNRAEELIGTELYVSKDKLPVLEEEEFYHTDLIDLKAKLGNKEIGKVIAVYNFGAGEVIELKINSTGKTEMLPFTKAYVPEINIKDGYIIVGALNFAEDEANEG